LDDEGIAALSTSEPRDSHGADVRRASARRTAMRGATQSSRPADWASTTATPRPGAMVSVAPGHRSWRRHRPPGRRCPQMPHD
jgi:hypothetical protein